MRLVACCVADHEVMPPYPDFVQEINLEQVAPRGTVERVSQVAAMRNAVMVKALQQYPNVTHVLMVDSYYVEQKDTIHKLIRAYDDPATILGASTLIETNTRLGPPETRFYDLSTTPEAAGVFPTNIFGKTSGRIRVRAVGGCYIFPIDVWKINHYEGNPDYFQPEHVALCRAWPTYLSLDHVLYREPIEYSFIKKLRIAGGYYRRKTLGF